jgi:hypothetical protein
LEIPGIIIRKRKRQMITGILKIIIAGFVY